MKTRKHSIVHVLIAGIGFIFLLTLAASIALVGMGMYRQGLRDTEEKARILMDRNLATHFYFNRVMKPRLLEWTASYRTKEYFEPSWMSSTYAIRRIHEYFGEINPSGYSIKDAALGARSPENEADALERSFLEELKADPALESRTAVETIGGQPYFVYLRKGEVMEKSCLLCHGRPEDAPEGLLGKYGPVKSFHRTVGDPISAISVRIPFSSAYAEIRHTMLSLTTVLLLCLGVLFAFQYNLYRKYLFDPLHAIRDKAVEFSREGGLNGEPIPPLASKEIDEVARAFNEMSAQLKTGRDCLEDQVRDRTRALEAVNERLVGDIAARREAEASLRASEERYRAIVENIEDGYHEVDRSGRFTFFNDSFRKILGYEPHELMGMHYRTYATNPANAEKVFQAYNRVYRTGEALERFEWDVVRKDGAVRTVEVSVSLIRNREGRPSGFRGIVRDVTDRKLAHEAVQESRDKLRVLAERLQQVREETMTTTAYKIHDDLGGNLSAMKMDLRRIERLALDIAEPGRRKELLAEIGASQELVDRSVAALRRIMMGLRPSILDDFGLPAAVEWQLEEFRKQTGISCEEAIEPLPEDLDRDVATAVFRIFQEALTNVACHTRAMRVSVRLHAEGGVLVLEVRDDGRGITDQEMAAPGSLGILGMRERALALGGELQIDGKPGKGTTLTLTVPLEVEGGCS